MTSTHVHLLYKKKSPLSSLDFFFGRSRGDIVRLSDINAEKSMLYSSTVVYLTLADLLKTIKVEEAKFMDYHWCISIHFTSFYFDEK